MSEATLITGLGVIAASGAGREALERALRGGEPTVREVDRSAGYHRLGGSRLAALVDPAVLVPFVPPALARRMSPPSRMAVAAARLAIGEAGISEQDPLFAETAVVVATSFGPALYTERLLESIFESGPESASPALFTESVASAAASQVAIVTRAKGPSVTVTQREAGPWLAVAEGARLLRTGKARRVLVGAVEEMTPLLHAILDRFHALARPAQGLEEAARPFDRRRNGFLAGEGATFLVMEGERTAQLRDAPALCRVEGAAAAFDPAAPVEDWGSGEGLGERLVAGLTRAGIEPATIDRVISGANGAVRGDAAEARVLQRVFAGRAMPPVLVPKAVVGEYAGVGLAAAILHAAGTPAAPPSCFGEPDEALGVVPHDGSPLPGARRILTGSLAAGGSAAWLVLGSAET